MRGGGAATYKGARVFVVAPTYYQSDLKLLLLFHLKKINMIIRSDVKYARCATVVLLMIRLSVLTYNFEYLACQKLWPSL